MKTRKIKINDTKTLVEAFTNPDIDVKNQETGKSSKFNCNSHEELVEISFTHSEILSLTIKDIPYYYEEKIAEPKYFTKEEIVEIWEKENPVFVFPEFIANRRFTECSTKNDKFLFWNSMSGSWLQVEDFLKNCVGYFKNGEVIPLYHPEEEKKILNAGDNLTYYTAEEFKERAENSTLEEIISTLTNFDTDIDSYDVDLWPFRNITKAALITKLLETIDFAEDEEEEEEDDDF